MGIETAATRGVSVHYGPRDTLGKFGRTGVEDGGVKRAEWVFDYNDLPSYTTSNLNVSIPAYAKIVSAKLEILTGFTSSSTTTDLDIGLYQADGTVIDADGLITAANATQTTIATRGNFVAGTGALVGASIGAAAGELVVAPTVADLTAGRGRVIVEYIIEKSGK